MSTEQKVVFRMSQVGKCPRALSAELLHYEPSPQPEYLERATEEGKWHEERIVQGLKARGGTVYDQQREVALVYPEFRLLGHIDGKYYNHTDWSSGEAILEIKSMSQFEFDRWMRGGFKEFYQYADQLTCYMLATGLKQALYIVKNRSSGYEDTRILTEPPSSIDLIIGRLMHVVSKGDLVLAEYDATSLECRRCEYKHLCVPAPKELSPATQLTLSHATSIWREGKQLVTQGQELVDEARTIFEEHSKATGVPKWLWDSLSINLIKGCRRSYDKTELLKLFSAEQLEPALKVQDYEQLRIEDLRRES